LNFFMVNTIVIIWYLCALPGQTEVPC
jgi:hypothetical protein